MRGPGNDLLELEDLAHEARLVDARRAREGDDVASGRSLDRGCVSGLNRLLVVVTHLDHTLLMPALDQERLVREELEATEDHDHPVALDEGLGPFCPFPV